jgi:hypothetical protein
MGGLLVGAWIFFAAWDWIARELAGFVANSVNP